jgi:O-antigen/teichoic acid export membrane protein
VWGFALLALGRYRGILLANLAALIASATITLALAPRFGAFGASFATLAGDSCLAVGYGIVLMRRDPAFRVALDLVPRVALACAAAASMLLVPGLPNAAALVLAGVVYVAVVVALRAIPAEIWAALGRSSGRTAG